MLKAFGLTSIGLFVRLENTLTLLSHSLNFWGLNDKVVNGVPENLFSVDDTATDSSVALPFPVSFACRCGEAWPNLSYIGSLQTLLLYLCCFLLLG